jgi:hypothetical protein
MKKIKSSFIKPYAIVPLACIITFISCKKFTEPSLNKNFLEAPPQLMTSGV